jgi:hypothetical protein
VPAGVVEDSLDHMRHDADFSHAGCGTATKVMLIVVAPASANPIERSACRS